MVEFAVTTLKGLGFIAFLVAASALFFGAMWVYAELWKSPRFFWIPLILTTVGIGYACGSAQGMPK